MVIIGNILYAALQIFGMNALNDQPSDSVILTAWNQSNSERRTLSMKISKLVEKPIFCSFITAFVHGVVMTSINTLRIF